MLSQTGVLANTITTIKRPQKLYDYAHSLLMSNVKKYLIAMLSNVGSRVQKGKLM